MFIKKNKYQTLNFFMILSITMILSGLIYEQIVFIPNFFNRNGIEPKELFSKFHVNTNPVHYHLIPTTILLITLIISWTNQLIEKNLLKSILISVLILISLTGYVVYFINDKLYFKTPLEEGDSIISLTMKWSFINIIRITTVFILFIKFYFKTTREITPTPIHTNSTSD
jgi:hypothetical protein